MKVSKSTSPTINMLASDKGWILGALLRDSALALGLTPRTNYFAAGRKELIQYPSAFLSRVNPKVSELNIWANHKTYLWYSEKGAFKQKRNRVFVTHFEKPDPINSGNLHESLRSVERFLVQNLDVRKRLVDCGIDGERIELARGAVDRDIFFPDSKRDPVKKDFVLISGQLKERKNPSLLSAVIMLMPNTNFILHCHFPEKRLLELFSPLANVRIYKFEQSRQPQLMRTASVYLNLAKLEGGPIGILESLASGTPVVATDTGFCREMVNSSTGKILALDATPEEVVVAIKHAMKMKDELRPHDLLNGANTWAELGEVIFGG